MKNTAKEQLHIEIGLLKTERKFFTDRIRVLEAQVVRPNESMAHLAPEMIRLRSKRMTYAEIAEIMGCAISTVHNYVNPDFDG